MLAKKKTKTLSNQDHVRKISSSTPVGIMSKTVSSASRNTKHNYKQSQTSQIG